MQARDFTVADLVDLRELAEDGEMEFVNSMFANRYFSNHNRWPEAKVVTDPKDSAQRLAFLAQSIGLITSYRRSAHTGNWFTVADQIHNTVALEELDRIEAERDEAYNASRQEDVEMWSDVKDILDSHFDASDLIADIAGDLSTRSVGEVVEDWLESGIKDANESIVNLIIDA